MNKIFNGIKEQDEILNNLKPEFQKLKPKITLVVVQVGNLNESNIFINRKKELAKELGVNFRHIKFDDKITTEQLTLEIKKLNKDKKVTGIIIQTPLPKHIEKNFIFESIDIYKDVDCLHPYNKGMFFIGEESFASPTTMAVIYILEKNKIDLKSKNSVVIGKGDIVGKPIYNYFSNKGSTVTICDKNTKNLSFFTKQADIIVSATGNKHLIKKDMVKENAIIIDFGTKYIDGKIFGDIDFEGLKSSAKFLTPTPGGTGPLTVTFLFFNLLKAYKIKK